MNRYNEIGIFIRDHVLGGELTIYQLEITQAYFHHIQLWG